MEIESEMKKKYIPYHRIRRITYEERVMWEKIADPKPDANRVKNT